MLHVLYNFSIHLYITSIHLASLFNRKAKLKVRGVEDTKRILGQWKVNGSERYILLHCASQGEHEQALPLIRWITAHTPYRLVVSFSSPSGFENADYTKDKRVVKIYLPFDTPRHMSNLIAKIDPVKVIIIKNEWWWNLLTLVKQRDIPCYLVSATIRESHYFIKYPMKFFRSGFEAFSSIFVVDHGSTKTLSKLYSDNIVVSGDTRIDQAIYNKENLPSHLLPNKEEQNQTIVYGSIWSHDMFVIKKMLGFFPDARHLIYPHELDKGNIQNMEKELQKCTVVKSCSEAIEGVNIISAMGELKFAYQLADMAYIGGGFGVGIHNILEASVFYIPTLIGPHFSKSNEAKQLTSEECTFVVSTEDDLDRHLHHLSKDSVRKEIESKLKSYFSPQFSPTVIICKEIFKKSILNV